ncbi:MAG: protein kinase, partial [Planctomycetaceae bacterium]|nr:protein kinase [Planctomycetaceae bacterium]
RIASAQLLTRFNREMKAAGKLHHPHIVTAHDAGDVDGAHFLVMEFVDGVDLSTLVKRRGSLSIPDACELIRQAALGLQHIADHGMVHRDIKPSNLMLARPTQPGETLSLKILDLGLAVFQEGSIGKSPEITETGQVIGTIDYMAPEQGLETPHQVDVRADLYSLGATFFKLLTGRAPFEEEKYNTTMKRLRALDREVPPRLDDLRPDCPRELADYVGKLLSKSPSDRPSSPADVAKSVTPFTKGANLAALLENTEPANAQAVTSVTSASQSMTPHSRLSADEVTVIQSPDQAPVQVAAVSGRGPFIRRWSLLAGASIVVALLAVLVIQTDRGTLEIQAPDDLIEQIQVSLFREGASTGTEYVVKPGKTELRIRSGQIEVKLPAELADQFELSPPNQLILSRNGRVTVRLTRRQDKENVKPVSADISPVVANPIDEPPPLEDWLKARKILTVAQDGSGQFKTIQAALDQVGSGEAIEVLDRGPYRERLSTRLPADCGLFSRVQTVVAFDEWTLGWMAQDPSNGKPVNVYLGYNFEDADQFRLHGFDLRFPAPKGTYEDGHWHHRLMVRTPKECVIENCQIRRSGQGCWDGEPVGLSNWDEAFSTEMSVMVRDCVIDGSILVNTLTQTPYPPDNRHGRVQLVRNIFPGLEVDHQVYVVGQNLQSLTVRDCVFSGSVSNNLLLGDVSEVASVEVHNCYFAGKHGIVFFGNTVPDSQVSICNNLRLGDGIVYFQDRGEQFRNHAQKQWKVDHNAYGQVKTPNTRPVSLRQSPTDVITQPQFLATNLDAPNAFRIASDDKLGAAGAGGTLPTYIGPLPPGPTPAGGDWFTRLRERWGDLTPHLPVNPPPPQGRTALDFNVSLDDGSGRVELPFIKDPSQPCTFEFYITPRSVPTDRKANRLVFGLGSNLMLVQRHNGWRWHGPDPDDRVTAEPSTAMTRIHLAVTSDNHELRIYADGKLKSKIALTAEIPPLPSSAILGGQWGIHDTWEPLDAVIDQFRYSTKVRYKEDFEPEPRMAADADTLILYNFEEGAGEQVKDSSGHGRHGKIIGAKWVRIEEPGASATSVIQPPIKIDEPPPLEDWLKGRTILTVAQDGSGQFTTIQSALDALKPGEVVKVLDKGPYKESLRLNNPPADIGLVTDQQTILEINGWVNYRTENSNFDYRDGHQLLNPQGFRLSGFHIVGTTDSLKHPYSALGIEAGARLVIEDSRFQFFDADKTTNPAVAAIRVNGLGSDSVNPIVVRDCFIEGNLSIQGWPGMIAPPVLIVRNLIEPWSLGSAVLVGGQQRRVSLRNNVVKLTPQQAAFVVSTDASGQAPEFLELVHNTVVGMGFDRFNVSAPASGVTIQGNVLPVFLLALGAEMQRDVIKNWEITGNWYLIRPESIPISQKTAPVFRRPDDPLVEPIFLSENPADRNFARVAPIDGVAPAGALPPGPAPKEGDWFTKLRERWGDLEPLEPQ